MIIPEVEKMPPEEIRSYQEKRLTELLQYVNQNSKFYRERFSENRIRVTEIKTIEDLTKIPVTTKDELQNRFGEFLCVEKNKIVDFITTSGTLGDPVTFAMTDKDLDRLAFNEYLSFLCAGTKQEDIYQLMVTMDRRFMAGMAYFLGLRQLGAGIIRVGPGAAELQFESIERFNPTGIITVPSFIPKLIQYAEDKGIDLQSLSVAKAVCIGEPIRNPDFSLNTLGRRIKDKWDLALYSTYASTEMGTAFTECDAGKGGHHHPDMIIVEFLDDNDLPVSEGQAGEVTITTLGVEAMPLVRFKTGDVCYHYTDPCSCGRTTLRLGPVIGRKQQMIKLKGTTIYPPALYDVLNDIDFVENFVVEVYTNDLGTDEIVVKVGCNPVSNHYEKLIKDHFRVKLRVAPNIILCKTEEISNLQFKGGGRKPVTFIDKRNN